MYNYKGLTTLEAQSQLKVFGSNEIKDVNKVSAVQILLRQIKSNFIVYLLFFAMLASFLVGKGITGYTILAVILIVVITGFIQEYKAEKAVEALKKMVMPISIVIRNGKELEIDSKDIVPGDILILRTGEKIPADCLILEQKDLLVNEAILTGESKEVKKDIIISEKEYKDNNVLFAGSFIVNGKALGKVIHTGMNTKFGKIASLISSTEKSLPLQNKINKITKYTAFVGMGMATITGLTILFGTPFSTELLVDVLILVIAISVSAFPEGLPVVLISTLSVGSYRMAKKNAIVNRMSIIETLGETTVICSDKTGTITKGEMTVKKIFVNNNSYDVEGSGFNANGNILLNKKQVDLANDLVLEKLLVSGIICNDANIQRTGEDKEYNIIGTPTEAALLILGAKKKLYKEDFDFNREEEIVFSSERKMMSVVIKDSEEFTIYTKGALEVLLQKCNYVLTDKGVVKLTKQHLENIELEFNNQAKNALRTIGLAYKTTKKLDIKTIEEDLIFIGFCGLEDPPREEVKESLIMCKKAGIKVKMITGDNKETAISIANQIGLEKGEVLLGQDLDKITDEELKNIVNKVTIFARVRPEHKLRIVKALKANGEIVTMTGDGVNDSPALKEAHIGVAMGKAGTDVSRSVADLTLKDDNFATIVDAIKEGRTIFSNIKKFVTYQLSCNFAELSILFFGVIFSFIFGWPVPVLLALHILFMNLVTDNLPAITLGLNRYSADIMDDLPRKNAEILTKKTFLMIFITGIIMASFTLLIFWFTYNVLGQTVSDARTTTLITLILVEIAGAFVYRSFRKGVLTRSPFVNPYLFIASTISILATIVIVYTPVNKIFETIPVPLIDWIVALGFAFLLIIIFDVFKFFNNKYKFFCFE